WFNTTHGIGIDVGEINLHGNAFAANVTVQGCMFTNVGGGIPPNFPGGGGVSLAIVNGDHILIQNNTFVDALGNTVLDIEPNTAFDPVTNIDIENNTISQAGTTGVIEPYVYGIVTHDAGGPFGPIIIK